MPNKYQLVNEMANETLKDIIGNEGGDKFWKWYGFEEHVHWCACYVSWCANECGYIDRGIIPKFALCTDGINWFKEKNEWHDRGESLLSIKLSKSLKYKDLENFDKII